MLSHEKKIENGFARNMFSHQNRCRAKLLFPCEKICSREEMLSRENSFRVLKSFRAKRITQKTFNLTRKEVFTRKTCSREQNHHAKHKTPKTHFRAKQCIEESFFRVKKHLSRETKIGARKMFALRCSREKHCAMDEQVFLRKCRRAKRSSLAIRNHYKKYGFRYVCIGLARNLPFWLAFANCEK